MVIVGNGGIATEMVYELDNVQAQVYKKQEMNFSFPGPKTENFTPTLPNN